MHRIEVHANVLDGTPGVMAAALGQGYDAAAVSRRRIRAAPDEAILVVLDNKPEPCQWPFAGGLPGELIRDLLERGSPGAAVAFASLR